MKYTLVSTCRNEKRSVNHWKQDILAQTRQPDEICIVDAVSDDGTFSILQAWADDDARVKLRREKSNPAKGRNLAVNISSGDVIVSTDMGCRLSHTWFEEITKPFETDPDVAVVAGNYGPDMDTIQTDVAWAAYYEAGGYRPQLVPGFLPSNRSVAYKRWAWDQLGGLPEDLTFAADDLVLSLQLIKTDFKIAYAASAMVSWARYPSFKDYWREQYRYGFGTGEANVMMQKSAKLVINGYPEWVLYFATLLKTFQESPKIMLRAIRQKRYIAAVFSIPLIYGMRLNYNKGFVKGYTKGKFSCTQCRKRLENLPQTTIFIYK